MITCQMSHTRILAKIANVIMVKLSVLLNCALVLQKAIRIANLLHLMEYVVPNTNVMIFMHFTQPL